MKRESESDEESEERRREEKGRGRETRLAIEFARVWNDPFLSKSCLDGEIHGSSDTH